MLFSILNPNSKEDAWAVSGQMRQGLFGVGKRVAKDEISIFEQRNVKKNQEDPEIIQISEGFGDGKG